MNETIIKGTLRDILEYVGADIEKFKNDAQLIEYLEWLIKRSTS